MSPELSRRDAIVALGAAGVTTAGLGALTWEHLDEGPDPPDRSTLLAAADALYPSDVEGIPSFVETYVVGRLQGRPDHREGVQAAATTLDEYARQWYDSPYAALDRETRQDIFDEFSVSTADPDPEGVDRERVRYYIVNELLFAFYSSPTGGELVGLENPQGHPGGTDSYQRGPD